MKPKFAPITEPSAFGAILAETESFIHKENDTFEDELAFDHYLGLSLQKQTLANEYETIEAQLKFIHEQEGSGAEWQQFHDHYFPLLEEELVEKAKCYLFEATKEH